MPAGLTTAFSVATGYGQPSFIPFDDGLKPHDPSIHAHQLSQDLTDRSKIESLCQRIANTLDSVSHRREVAPTDEIVMQALREDLSQLQTDLVNSETSGGQISICSLYVSSVLKLTVSRCPDCVYLLRAASSALVYFVQ